MYLRECIRNGMIWNKYACASSGMENNCVDLDWFVLLLAFWDKHDRAYLECRSSSLV